MGGRFGRNRNPPVDPFYEVPPPIPFGEEPLGEFITSDPSLEFSTEFPPVSPIQALYGRPNASLPNVYVNFYAPEFNQMSGITPWNYGNYFLGNTAMQMMPGDIFGSSLMSPYWLPPSLSMPIGAPMMAAATPLPVAFNPLVQGMYPMASVNPVNWMDPSSFMTALSCGPMPYRPPGIDFPTNVGAVMTIPYGTPNPLLSVPSYGGSGSAGSISYYGGPSLTAAAPSPNSNYPYPSAIPRPYLPPAPNVPQPYPSSMPVHSIRPLPTVQPAVIAAPSTTANYNQVSSPQVTSSLPNQGVSSYAPPSQASYQTPVSQPYGGIVDRARQFLPSFTRSLNSNYDTTNAQSRRDPVIPPVQHGQIISDSGWLPTTGTGTVVSDSGWLPKKFVSRALPSLLNGKKRRQTTYPVEISRPTIPSSGAQVTFYPRRRQRQSSSSASEYDCPICQQQRDLHRLRENYGSSTISSLLSSPQETRRHRATTTGSVFSSTSHGSASSKQGAFKSHRRHPIRIKNATKTPSPKPSTSPIFLRKSPIAESINDLAPETLQEEEEHVFLKNGNAEKTIRVDIDSASEKSN